MGEDLQQTVNSLAAFDLEVKRVTYLDVKRRDCILFQRSDPDRAPGSFNVRMGRGA